MATNVVDVMVLGAGIVGISSAIHLQRQGFATTLVDRRGAGEETSFGNAGIIQREGVHPYMFPSGFCKLIAYALNRRIDARYHVGSLARIAPFLWRYWRASNSATVRQTLQANLPLFAECLEAHAELACAARSETLIAKHGWIRLIRNARALAETEREISELKELGLDACLVGGKELRELEPDIDASAFEAAVHHRQPWTVSDPGALVKSYASLFVEEGGRIVQGDALKLGRSGGYWRLATAVCAIASPQIVVALGPWSMDFLKQHGVRLPMGIKRGYHCHFRPANGAVLHRPVVDEAYGYVLAPMTRGMRITSGIEFAALDAPRTPVQIEQLIPRAREIFPLAESLDAQPWMGMRPVFPDMLPVIGKLSGAPATWVNFGHGHHGFTLGPATGKLLAQLVAGAPSFCDPEPYRPARFGKVGH
jgi:D-amino-acid dehydrogenase